MMKDMDAYLIVTGKIGIGIANMTLIMELRTNL